jgi:hypothetical protein
MRTCKGCTDRKIEVNDGVVYTCKATCKDYKVRKLREQLINKRKTRDNKIRCAIIDKMVEQRKHAGKKFGHQNDRE